MTRSKALLVKRSMAAWVRTGSVKVARRVWDGKWRPLLQAWDYGPGAECTFTDCGAYREKSWSSWLSGVLVTHGDELQWLPNPFAEAMPAEPRLLGLRLSIAKLGSRAAAWRCYP